LDLKHTARNSDPYFKELITCTVDHEAEVVASEKRRGSAGLIKSNLRLFVELSVLELPRVSNTFPKAAQALDFRLLYPTDGCFGQVTSSSKQWLCNFFLFV